MECGQGLHSVSAPAPNAHWALWDRPHRPPEVHVVPVAGATGYRISFYGPSGIIFDANLLDPATECPSGSCSTTPGYTFSAGDYSFTIRSANAVGEGAQSAPMAFTVSPPAAPTPIGPSGTVSTSRPTFSWYPTTGATSYRVSLYNDGGLLFVTAALDPGATCPGGVCSFTPGPAFPAGNYSFRVRASSNVGDSAQSAFLAFTIVGPAAPSLIAPSGPMVNPRPTYRWQSVSGATRYAVVFLKANGSGGYDMDYTTNVLSPATACTATECQFTPGTPRAIGSYAFQVVAQNESGDGPWSAAMAYSIQGLPAPTPLAPDGGSGDRPVFTWSPVAGGTPEDGALQYVTVVRNLIGEVAFAQGYYPDICTAGVCTAAPDFHFDGGTYTWTSSREAPPETVAERRAHVRIAHVGRNDGSGPRRGQASGRLQRRRPHRPALHAGRRPRAWRSPTATCGLPTEAWHPAQGWLDVTWDDPIVGDFNGDGQADIAQYENAGSLWRVALSQGDHFGPLTLWGVASAQWTDGLTYTCRANPFKGTGNFDGNGLTDVYCRFGSEGKTFVGKSTGHSFDFSIFADYRCGRHGAGRARGLRRRRPRRLVLRRTAWAVSSRACSNGTSFTDMSFTALSEGYCAPEDLTLVDINGDGRADITAAPSNSRALDGGVLPRSGVAGRLVPLLQQQPQCEEGGRSATRLPEQPTGVQHRATSRHSISTATTMAELVCTHTGSSGTTTSRTASGVGTTLGPETFWSRRLVRRVHHRR